MAEKWLSENNLTIKNGNIVREYWLQTCPKTIHIGTRV